MQFQRYQAKRREIIRPTPKSVSSDAKMESSTSNRTDYIPHPITPSPPKPVVVYKAPEERMNTSTEYKELFKGKWAIPVKQIRPQQAKREKDEPFNHQSTHSVEYVVHTLQPYEAHGPKYRYETPTEPFVGASTARSDFVDFGVIHPPKSLKPQESSNVSSKSFEGMSSYRDSFTSPEMPARYQHPKQVYTPSGKEFYSSTTFKTDFVANVGAQPAKSLKPLQAKVKSDVPFEGNTTSRMSYTKWDLPSKFLRPPTVYTPPSEKFAVHTSYREDYPTYEQFARAKSLKPTPRREELVNFEGVTSNSEDYKFWADAVPRSSIRLEKKYSPPSEKFDGISTFQAHFQGEFTPRASSTKPQLTPYAKSCAMEDSTTYRDSYSNPSSPVVASLTM